MRLMGHGFPRVYRIRCGFGLPKSACEYAAYHTVMTPAISGRPARCLSNSFTALGECVASGEIPAYPIAYAAGKALAAAAKAAGDAGYGAQWAGQGAPLVRQCPASQLVSLLSQEITQRS